MKKIFKWFGIVLGSVMGLVILAAATLYIMGNARVNKTYDFPPSGIVAPIDAESIARGKHIIETTCVGCHGTDLSGVSPFVSIGPIMTLDSANLTPGEGGIGGEFTDEDYVRAIRHGIDPEGKPLYMPSVPAFQYMSDEDLGAIIAYLKTIPPVDHQTNGFEIKPLGYILMAAGMFGNLPVEDAGHANNVTAPEPGVTVEYGEYRLTISDCRGCHGEELAGGPYPDPSIVYTVPNLTPGGDLSGWTEEGFIQTIRMQITPDGRNLNSNLMPLDEINNLTDDELRAIFLYLQSLPALEQVTGQ
ncbi:MAG: c-type cytochrome [Chloroflexi bacterium]|nr:c-type cytochrome [Chloroflexota bacterium]